ncbi:hypothetical protein PVA44_05970 [Entomospira nematocerorum]|uniref:Nitrogen regulatory protein P-II n=1 Tax=Entomospira nematocerorum TaxID=2719987 RepID=A0A968GBX7_9SPIO|nr:PG0541 family transporter-associated protein [Entomospira nematocera]NIZ46434.1 hypothetical protein [Entomospira nematocera]WDI33763.1 hypothetical protein PVA44_05970 [Entomospira nematocera]
MSQQEKLYRIEIIANQAVRDEIIKEFTVIGCNHYTEIPLAYGKGRQEPKQGDSIWPETNIILIIYANHKTLLDIKSAIAIIKETFPHEGIKMFVLEQS